MNIFEYENYRKIIKKWISEQPKQGHGQNLKMAQHLRMDASIFSKILNEERELGIENAYLLAEYMGLIPIEKEYFIHLALLEKSSNYQFKNYIKDKVTRIKKESQNLSERISSDKKSTEEEKSKFYSSWLYSAIWLQTSIGTGRTFLELQKEFQIPSPQLTEIIEFLLQTGLILMIEGKYQMGATTIFVGKDSPMLVRHHMNWRLKVMDKAILQSKEDLIFTSPLTCSEKDFETIKERIAQLIQETIKIAQDSKAEKLVYFGVDCFKVLK